VNGGRKLQRDLANERSGLGGQLYLRQYEVLPRKLLVAITRGPGSNVPWVHLFSSAGDCWTSPRSGVGSGKSHICRCICMPRPIRWPCLGDSVSKRPTKQGATSVRGPVPPEEVIAAPTWALRQKQGLWLPGIRKSLHLDSSGTGYWFRPRGDVPVVHRRAVTRTSGYQTVRRDPLSNRCHGGETGI
jgi:hypothetical protein